MTTKVTILNHGPKAISVIGGTFNLSVEIRPHHHMEMWLHEGSALQIEEETAVVPNLAGGPGEPNP